MRFYLPACLLCSCVCLPPLLMCSCVWLSVCLYVLIYLLILPVPVRACRTAAVTATHARSGCSGVQLKACGVTLVLLPISKT